MKSKATDRANEQQNLHSEGHRKIPGTEQLGAHGKSGFAAITNDQPRSDPDFKSQSLKKEQAWETRAARKTRKRTSNSS